MTLEDQEVRFAVKPKQSGVTLVEILVVLGIIAILASILIPATQVARRLAKNTQQRAQLASIELGLEAFKGDYGDYPPSEPRKSQSGSPGPRYGQSGGQNLAEALLGRDLRGFDPNTGWDFASDKAYGANSTRKARYLDSDTANAFRLGDSLLGPGLYPAQAVSPLYLETFVLCDVFGRNSIRLADNRVLRAGSPILYYKAGAGQSIDQIYKVDDNWRMICTVEAQFKSLPSKPRLNYYVNGTDTSVQARQFFYLGDPETSGYIRDPMVSGNPYPYNPDSYLLVSAGEDGLYGTADDIRNFGNN